MKYIPTFETRTHNIPCGVVVTAFVNRTNLFNRHLRTQEINWFLIDRKGYRAIWLENILTREDEEKIEQEIINQSKNYD